MVGLGGAVAWHKMGANHPYIKNERSLGGEVRLLNFLVFMVWVWTDWRSSSLSSYTTLSFRRPTTQTHIVCIFILDLILLCGVRISTRPRADGKDTYRRTSLLEVIGRLEIWTWTWIWTFNRTVLFSGSGEKTTSGSECERERKGIRRHCFRKHKFRVTTRQRPPAQIQSEPTSTKLAKDQQTP
jgi:hypothetical protein